MPKATVCSYSNEAAAELAAGRLACDGIQAEVRRFSRYRAMGSADTSSGWMWPTLPGRAGFSQALTTRPIWTNTWILTMGPPPAGGPRYGQAGPGEPPIQAEPPLPPAPPEAADR